MTVTPGGGRRARLFSGSGGGRATAVAAVALVLLVACAYAPVVRCGFIWDDDAHVTGNTLLRSGEGLVRIWTRLGPLRGGTPQYYPLTHVTFWVEHHLWGDWPVGYHVDNVLLHAATAVMVWRLLRRLRVPGSWLAAALWAVHPVNVESVAWVTERKNVLSAFFYVAAATVYLRTMIGPPRTPTPVRIALGPYLVAFALFVCALLSKTTAGTWPAAMLVVIWWHRGRLTGREVVRLIPFFIVGGVAGSLTGWIERTQVGAAGPEYVLSAATRVLIAGRAIWFYVGKLLVPMHLSFIYPRWPVADHAPWYWAVPLGAAGAVLVVLWAVRRRLGRGPAAGWMFFCGTLFPALGFVNVYPMRYSFVADHFQYLAGLAIVAVVAGALATAARRRGAASPLLPFLSAVLLVPLVALTFARTHVYRSQLTLWSDTAARNPESAIAQNNLSSALLAAGRFDEAEPHVRAAIRLSPGDIQPVVNLGRLKWARGDVAGARASFGQAAAAAAENDDAHVLLAQTDQLLGDVTGAEAEYRQAILLNGGNTGAVVGLARILLGRGAVAEARGLLERAARVAPDDPGVLNLLGAIAGSEGRLAAAEALLRRAIEVGPRSAEAHNNLGSVLKRQGRIAEAAAEYRAALAIEPGFETARRNLTALEAATGPVR